MYQKDIEKFAFLYMCGQRDKCLIQGKVKMTFQDFDRLVFITEFLGFDRLSLEIWNQFSAQFQAQLEDLENQLPEDSEDMASAEFIVDTQLRDQWLKEFCASVPDEEARGLINNRLSKIW